MVESHVPTALADGQTAALLTVRQVAELLVCSPRHVYRLSDAGRMPRPVRLGGLIRWQKSEIDAWLAAGCPPARSMPKVG